MSYLNDYPTFAVVEATAATGENASVENPWCQLWDTVRSPAFAVLSRLHPHRFDVATLRNSDCERYGTLGRLARPRNFKGKRTATDGKFLLCDQGCPRSPTKGTAPLLSADGSTLLTEKTQILQQWSDHFKSVPNRPSTISDAAIARLLQVKTNVDLDLPPSLRKTIRAVQQLFTNKLTGSDTTPTRIYKNGVPHLMDYLTALFQEMWRQE
nr:unnamed protein product [Spirometra erinaceieuropaei]